MVDSVNSSHAARPRLMPVSTEGAAGGASGAKAHKPVSSVDSVKLSSSASVGVIEKMVDQGPPFDAARVSRIKDAVANGNYPVDAKRIADSIFQDYSAMTR
ncbi:MAG: flagellar biosynthesis anti-sigma factor FlgM [Roseovarius sp.]|uniref:flagellar biosynthesis anti-sigma factor FlgM n=1 Tax=Roseovarius sp. TaxID=1486281 RepID=UPI001B797ACD|nr:flagellar biosynthesis anti-sigma factor FlgM [Roseovarius sp.]MBQ0751494.1 flagellar biosynthesis anti-sigma factor FlgM [Roseovarius sp.]MBQ0809061.1 flagellar biosynthesis anti-sigma factor FlgM [Roseovarius sp.]